MCHHSRDSGFSPGLKKKNVIADVIHTSWIESLTVWPSDAYLVAVACSVFEIQLVDIMPPSHVLSEIILEMETGQQEQNYGLPTEPF